MPLQKVKNLVIQKFGKDIRTHYDVIQLQEAIINASGKRISTQTIKRLFGLIKSSSKPDPATLDAVAGYLHFSSYLDLKKWLELTTKNEHRGGNEWASEVVLQIVKDIKPENLHEPGLLQLIKNLFILLERHPELPAIIYPRLAASEFGRRYFFEQFIHYDALAFHYGMGLEQYLVHESHKGHRAFAYSMLCMRSYLTGNHEACRFYFTHLSTYTREEIDGFHPFVVGRFYASKVFMNAIEGLNAVEYVNEQVQQLMVKERKATDLYDGYPCAEMVFAEALIHTGHFQQAYILLNNNKVLHYIHPPYMDIAFKTHLLLVKLVAGIYSSLISHARAIKELKELEEAPIYFLCQHYIQLLIHLVKLKLEIQPTQTAKKVKRYYEMLGFITPSPMINTDKKSA